MGAQNRNEDGDQTERKNNGMYNLRFLKITKTVPIFHNAAMVFNKKWFNQK